MQLLHRHRGRSVLRARARGPACSTRLASRLRRSRRALEAPGACRDHEPRAQGVQRRRGCKTLTPQVWPGRGAAPRRDQRRDRGRAARRCRGRAKATSTCIDVTKPKKLASFRYARGDYKCGEVAMLGDTIYVGDEHVRRTPSGRAALYSAKGKKIANVGGKDFGTLRKRVHAGRCEHLGIPRGERQQDRAAGRREGQSAQDHRRSPRCSRARAPRWATRRIRGRPARRREARRDRWYRRRTGAWLSSTSRPAT